MQRAPTVNRYNKIVKRIKYNPETHHRRSIRIEEYDYSQEGLYFITICTFNYKRLFGYIDNGEMVLGEYGEIVHNEWLRTGEMRKNIILNEFVMMPNHMHGIIEIDGSTCRGTSLVPLYTVIQGTRAQSIVPLQNNLVNQRQIQFLPLFVGTNQRLQNR